MDDVAMLWTMRRCDWAMLPHRRIVHIITTSSIASPHRPSHRLIVHRIASSSIASPHRPSHRLIVHRIASSSIASPHRASHRRIASPHRASHLCIDHRIASSCIASPHYLKRQCEPSRPSYEHDLPLFAISYIHKLLRSASSQPGCYTLLYFYSLTTSASFSFDLSCCQQML